METLHFVLYFLVLWAGRLVRFLANWILPWAMAGHALFRSDQALGAKLIWAVVFFFSFPFGPYVYGLVSFPHRKIKVICGTLVFISLFTAAYMAFNWREALKYDKSLTWQFLPYHLRVIAYVFTERKLPSDVRFNLESWEDDAQKIYNPPNFGSSSYKNKRNSILRKQGRTVSRRISTEAKLRGEDLQTKLDKFYRLQTTGSQDSEDFAALHKDIGRSLKSPPTTANNQQHVQMKTELQQEFIHAAQHGDLDTLKALHEAGIGLNVRSELGYTALMEAAQYGFEDVTRYLVENGADINAATQQGETARTLAELNGRAKVLQILLKAESEREASERKTPAGATKG